MSGAGAVLFDLDDTLYPERQFVASGFRAVAGFLAERFRLDAEEVRRRLTAILAAEGRGRVFDRLLADLGLGAADLVTTLVYVYRSHRPAIALPAATREVLAHLRGAGWRLGVVTDGMGSVQRRKIEALGVEALVDAVVCTDELGPGAWKPDPRGYRVALELLGASLGGAIYVGDNPEKDFRWPNGAGMVTVQLLTSGRDPATVPPADRAAHVLGELGELPPLLARLGRGARER